MRRKLTIADLTTTEKIRIAKLMASYRSITATARETRLPRPLVASYVYAHPKLSRLVVNFGGVPLSELSAKVGEARRKKISRAAKLSFRRYRIKASKTLDDA